MSEFLAEARVLIRPDTTKFRADLEAQLLAATKGVTVPIPVAAAPTTAAATTAVQKAQIAATRQQAAAHEEVVVAASEQAGVQRVLEQQTLKLTAAQRAEIKANDLLTKSAAQLAEAETLASLKTTELAAARARLAGSSRAVATAERAVQAALISENVELEKQTRVALADAQAQQALFQTKVRSTIAADAHTAALQREARSEALVARGAASTGLAMAGARGATLAASSGFLVGAAAAVFLAESIKQATDAEETFRRATFLLGDQIAGQLADQAQIIGEAFAIDDDDVLKFETQIGKILKAASLPNERIAELSQGVVKLATDMAAFNRVPVDDVLKALQSGLAGNARALRQFGVLLDSASVRQRALADTGKESSDELTRQELILARYSLILEQAAFQQGAFADQANSLAAQSQRLRVNFEELQETIGKGLTPVVLGLVEGLNANFTAMRQLSGGVKNLASDVPILSDEIAGVDVGGFVTDLVQARVAMLALPGPLGLVAAGFQLFGDEAEEAGKKLTIFDRVAGVVAGTLGGLTAALQDIRAGLPTQAQRDELSLTLAQAGGDPTAELQILREREQRQAAFLERREDTQ